MTETTFPFGEPADPAPFEDDGADDGASRRPVLLVGGLVGALVLGAGAFLFLGSGGSDADDVELSLVPRSPSAAAPAAEPEAADIVPAALEQPIGRNPFKAKFVEPVGASATDAGVPAGTTTGATSGSTGSGTGSTGSTSTTFTITDDGAMGPTGTSGSTGSTGSTGSSGSTTPPIPTDPPEPTDPGDPPADPAPDAQPRTPPKQLSLTKVDSDANQLTFEVLNRESKEGEEPRETIIVKPGEVFATYFKLFGYGSLKGADGQLRNCADLLYGDAQLKLCEGESYQAS